MSRPSISAAVCILIFAAAAAFAAGDSAAGDSAAGPQQMAALHPQLVWQRISPTSGKPEGPVLYQIQIVFGTPNTVQKLDASGRHLMGSQIMDDGTMVTIGGPNGLVINPSGNILTFGGVSLTGGGSSGLTSVSHDSTLTGNGTAGLPLGVSPSAVVTSLNALHGAVSLAVGSGLTLSTNANTITINDTDTGGGGDIRTVTVHPVPGDPVASGTALLNAVAGITTASASNPYLVKIEPGTYDLGTNSLSMKQYVDIEGSGPDSTVIRSSGNASNGSGTVIGADNAEIRHLTVDNIGSNTCSVGIYNNATAPKITDVTIVASGGSFLNYGIFNVNNASPTITAPTISVTAIGTSVAYGIVNYGGSSPAIINPTITASGGEDAWGISNNNGSPAVTNPNITVSGATRTNRAIYNSASSNPTVTGLNATVSGPSGSANEGVHNDGSTGMLNGGIMNVSGGSNTACIDSTNSSIGTDANVSCTASGASSSNQGFTCGTGSFCIIRDSTASVGGTNASSDCGGCNSSASAIYTNVELDCTGLSGPECDGVMNTASSATIRSSALTAAGSTASNGIKNSGSMTETNTISNSTIVATAASDSSACTTCKSMFANSQLGGMVMGGTNSCANTTNTAMNTNRSSTCQ